MRDQYNPAVIMELLRAIEAKGRVTPKWLGAPGGFQEQMSPPYVDYDTSGSIFYDTSGSSIVSNLNLMRWWYSSAKWFQGRETNPTSASLWVEPGICYPGLYGPPDIWPGGTSGSFTPPSANPRIDVLYYNPSDDALHIQQGAEAASPTPSYPTSGSPFPICEVYLRTTGGSIFNRDTAGQHYIYRDVRPFLNLGSSGSGAGTDELVKVSANDTTADHLINKLVAGTGPISLTETNDGGDENVTIDWAWGNVVTVMKSGGDYTTVTSALAAITDAAADNRYTILVGPDVGHEVVTLKSYVDIVGTGTYCTGANSTPTALAIQGSPTDVSIHNMLLAENLIGETVDLDGGNVDFYNCRIIWGATSFGTDDCVDISSGTHRFFDCVIEASGYSTTGGANAVVYVTGGTVEFYGGKIENTAATAAFDGISCSGGTVRLFGGVRVVATTGQAIDSIGGTIEVYAASFDPTDITGTLTGADKDLVVGELKVIKTPSARVYNSADETITTSTPTAVTFDSERWDTDSIHSVAANTSRLTCQTAGVYTIEGHISWASNATGIRQLFIKLNNSNYIAAQSDNPGVAATWPMTVSTQYQLAVGEYVELIVNHTKGDDLDIKVTDLYSIEFAMTLVR